MPGESVDTTIGSNVKIEGNLKNMGSIEINGEVTGEIHSEENVFVGQSAQIKGPVLAKNVTVAGAVIGPVDAADKLEILPSGRVEGDISMQQLVIQQGAQFVGKSAMKTSEAMVGQQTADKDEALAVLLENGDEEADEENEPAGSDVTE